MKLNFIKDKETNLEKDDLLGTKSYVNTLLEVIRKVDTPFTIGLFGGWGTGKSSIIRTIETKYNNDESSKVKVFVYDAWKYSNDSFRRTFILKLKEEFGLEEDVDYQNFYNDKHEDIAHKNQIDGKKAFLGLLYLLPLLLFIVWFIPSANVNLQIALSFISVISTITFYFLKDVYVQYKISVTKPKAFAPEQFEDAFTDAVQKITTPTIKEKCKNWFKTGKKTIFSNRIVIIIDNIDRCHKELAFELLMTIKTFLEQKDKEIVFILPIDENELKKHIKEDGHDGNEFLRKLFNTTLTIKKFSEDDLFNFSKELQKKHNLDLSDDVLSLISQEFSKSPRKIIQFLNVLQTEIKLAEEQEKKDPNNRSNFKKGDITENIEFLVKTLLIREEWTEVYEKLKENPFLLEEINEQIDDNKDKVIYGKVDKEKDIFLTDEQRRFFESTRDISTQNIEVFFSNRDAFPGIPDDVQKLVLAQDWKTVKTKYLEKKIFDLSNLIYFVDNLFDREVIKKKLLSRSGFNIFSFIFKISEDEKNGESLLKSFYSNGKSLSKIRTKLNSKEISTIILNFNPTLLLNFVGTNLNKNSRLLQKIINTINKKENDDEKRYDLLTEFINKFQKEQVHLRKIGTRFSEMLKEDPDVFDDFKNVLKIPTVAESLIKQNLIEEFIKNLEVSPEAKDTKIIVEMINQYNSLKSLSNKLLKQYIEKIIEFIANNNLMIASFWLEQLKPLIEKIKEESLKNSILNTLNQKYTFLLQQYNSRWNEESYQMVLQRFLEVANKFYVLSEASESEIETWINNFFSRNESPKIAIRICKLYMETIEYFLVFDWSFSQQLINKFNRLSEWEDKKEIAKTLNLMLSKTTDKKGLNKSQIQTILNNYINNISSDEETIKKWLLVAIENPVIKIKFKQVIQGLDIYEKLGILEVIKEIDKTLLKECVEEIIFETDTDNLEKVFEILDSSGVGLTLINNGIEKRVKSLQKDDNEDFFQGFLQFIVERKLTQNILIAVVNKISSFLHDEKTNEEKIFAMQILDKITVPKDKKTLIKELLRSLNVSEFDDAEKQLYERVKKKK